MSNAPSCSNWRLYVIADAQAAGKRDLAQLAAAAIRGGADVIQIRNKAATTRALLAETRLLLAVTRPRRIPLIVNDRVDVALAAGADGVHLGQDDMPVAEARRLMPPGALIGQSTHSLEQALAGAASGADYIGVGPVFATPTKPDYGSVGLELVRRVRQSVKIPFVAIGGIDAANADAVAAAGAGIVAVVRAVCAAEEPENAARELRQALVKFHPQGLPG